MSLQDEINIRIKEEIAKDPFKIGYEGKTDEQIKEMLNSPVKTTRTVIDISQSPMNRILSGLAGAPNAVVDTAEVTTAKAAEVVEKP
jgi:hypothetical protein